MRTPFLFTITFLRCFLGSTGAVGVAVGLRKGQSPKVSSCSSIALLRFGSYVTRFGFVGVVFSGVGVSGVVSGVGVSGVGVSGVEFSGVGVSEVASVEDLAVSL